MAAYERLTSLDRVFLDIESYNSHMHVAGILIFDARPLRRPDGGLDIDAVRIYIASRLHRIPRYRQKLAYTPIERAPVWVDDDRFNIDYHLRHTCLPHPGDDAQLKRLSGRIMSQQLDRGKPLWECWIVEGLEGDRFALVSKTHHCMIDGISGVDLMSVLLSPFPDVEPHHAPRWTPQRTPTTSEMLRSELWRRATTPLSVAGDVCQAVRNPGRTLQSLSDAVTGLGDALATSFRRGSDTPLNRPIGPHRRFDWLAFDLTDVKAIKNALGGTVNDVVLATVTGAVGSFLEQRGVTAARQAGLDFRAFCPVSVRSDDERGTLGNRVAGMIVGLPISERDARRKLETVRRATRDVKQSKQALGAEVLTAVGEWTVPTLLSLATRLTTGSRVYNMVVTNVPGPQIPLYMLGARMLETYPMVPLFHSQGLGIALFSYAGHLFWGLNADWDLVPDLPQFVEAMQQSFDELRAAAGVGPAATPTDGHPHGRGPGSGNGASSALET